MTNKNVKIFNTFEVQGAKLYYDETIPVLMLSSNSYMNGFNHGKYLSRQISQLVWRMKVLLYFCKKPNMTNIHVSKAHGEEIKGLVDGYNSTRPWIALDEKFVLMYHLMPEITHGCSTLMGKDEFGNAIMCRNMDWIPYGKLSNNTLLIHWKTPGVYSMTIPGLIGVITGWNKQNLYLSMNACKVDKKAEEGFPSLFLNRKLLEESISVRDASHKIEFEKYRPAYDYHLSMIDNNDMVHFQFSLKNKYIKYTDSRHATDYIKETTSLNDNGVIGVFNFTHKYGGERLDDFSSMERTNKMSDIIESYKKSQIFSAMYYAIRSNPLNNFETCHSAVFYPAKNIIRLSWNNGFAASNYVDFKMTYF